MDGNENIYEAEVADKIVSDLFQGKLTVEQCLQRLRTRLLDLSSRNGLLNYRHPKRRSVQFINEPNLNLVFNRLLDGKSLLVKYIPDPPPKSYVTRPDVKTYAQFLGINTNTTFSLSSCSSSGNKHTPKLQVLYYPTDLDKLCRKLSSEARTIIEETGSNMLYLIFGFLEFLEREDSEKPMLAPLLAVPVNLEKGNIDPDTRTYQYSIVYSGEDVHENKTLREKLNQDFCLQLPEFDEEEDPGSYFSKIQLAIQKKKHWQVKYQLTLGFLSFGKLAIWNDLDPKKWPSLINHSLLKEIFSGNCGQGASLFPEDYEIDKHPQGDLPIIYDADSSQHSAIVDVLSGKNMVINGPPGTGKSQTITNVIAAALRDGKRVLFVSEKLAALEVVRHRLNQANLGHFCLELHSHKTQKKKLLSDIQERLDKRFRPPQQLDDKLSTLKRHKKKLNRYAELMASRVGNELGLTVHEIFWRTEYRRQAIGDQANAVPTLFLVDAPGWVYDDIELRRTKLEALGQLFVSIDTFDSNHPWWGFVPQPLAPGDDESIRQIIIEGFSLAEELVACIQDYQTKTGDNIEPSLDFLENLHHALKNIPNPPENLNAKLIPRIFTKNDQLCKCNRDVLTSVIRKVEIARKFNKQADELLVPNCDIDCDSEDPVVVACSKELGSTAFSISLHALSELVESAQQTIGRFEQILSRVPCSYVPIQASTLENFDAIITRLKPFALLEQSINNISNGVSVITHELVRLQNALDKVTSIANRRNIDFNGSPDAVKVLGGPDGIEELLPGVQVDDTVLQMAEKAAEYLLSGLPISELNERQFELHRVHERISTLMDEIGGYAQQFGMPFDNTPTAIDQLRTLAQIASCAPVDLLDFRRTALAQPRSRELIRTAEEAYSLEKSLRERLSNEFYLDNLPTIEELKSALQIFRRGDNIFNVFNSEWRNAKKMLTGISKTKTRRKAADYEIVTSDLVNWMIQRFSFINNQEFKDTFGPLFNGIDTDFSNIRRLHSWYMESHAEMLKHPGLIESVNISSTDPLKLNQLAALSSRLQVITTELSVIMTTLNRLLGPVSNQLESNLLRSGWSDYQLSVFKIAEGLKKISTFLGHYVREDVSPKHAIEVLNAKLDITSAHSEFHALSHGVENLHKAIVRFFPGIIEIPCHHWGKYLDRLSGLTKDAIALQNFAGEYASGEATVSDIRLFIQSKLQMDAELEKFAPSPRENTEKDWQSYVSKAYHLARIGKQLVQLLLPASGGEKTAYETVLGLNARKKANILMREIEDDTTINMLLQDLFLGAETDLESLRGTLTWCESIIENISIGNSPLKDVLLSLQAKDSFSWAQRNLRKVEALRGGIKNKLQELSKFGSFDWAAWNANEQSHSKDEFAGTQLQRLQVVAQHIDDILPWSKYHAERLACINISLGDFVAALEHKKLSPSKAGGAFEYIVYRSIGRNIYKSLPELEKFSGVKHEKRRTEFIALDQEIISLTGKSFAYEIDKVKKVPDGDVGYRASDRTEMQLLFHELGKQRRHLPIRQLIKRAGRAIQALKPCFMMGPMSVAQYLEQGTVMFNLVVMDEASQLRPEDALGAIARGSQLVVVGDPKQLPPTNFFDRLLDAGDEDEEDQTPAVLSGSESILDICQQLFHPVRTLRWHYRSQHQSLIAFSNHHFYNGKLVVFPSPFERNNRLGLRFRFIKNGAYKDRQNVPEAQRVVDAAIEQMINYPEDSFGIVTLNQTQRDLIEDLFDKKHRNIEEAQNFIVSWEEKGWPFFIKNLENVQGDERDVIFISATFGKSPGTNKVRQNFGPISRPDGWRRLNVLFTRARRKIELFSSMQPEDILLESKTPAGTRSLKDYLDFAKRGVLSSVSISEREPDSDFEIAVGDMLRNRGYDVVPQLGVAGFFIDLVVRNPKRPGEFLAAVECDGAAYHSSRSARDRDRIRQAILESLGWKDRIWRIWSTDWFYNPRQETERLLTFLQKRQSIAESEPSGEFYFYDDQDESQEVDNEATVESASSTIDHDLSISEEELFVEVGDNVIYYFIDNKDHRHSVRIVDTESNPRNNLINENTPLARALLNAAVGDEIILETSGKPNRTISVMKIVRQRELFVQ